MTLCALALTGCATVGPDYRRPPAVGDAASTRGRFVRAETPPAAPASRWWTALGDPVLDGLIDDALHSAPQVAVAEARIAQSRAALAARRTASLPGVGVSGSAPYFNVPANVVDPGADGEDRRALRAYSVGFDTQWEIDLFGGRRRQQEGAAAELEAAQAGLADAQVALAAEVARAYTGLRSRQAAGGVLARQRTIDLAQRELAAARLAGGTAPAQPLEQARATLAQGEAEIALNDAEIRVLADQIALLTGREPGTLDDALVRRPAPLPLPPATVAVDDPAAMLRRRPDVRIAERRLAAANAEVGARIADKFPKVSLIGNIGIGGRSLGDVFDPTRIIGIALPRITWPLFDGGRAEAQVRGAKAGYAEAEARYRQTVLAALQEAEGALARYGAQRVAWGKALAASDAAERIARLQRQRARAGTVGESDALTAERQALAARQGALRAQAELTAAYVALSKALGLGWDAPVAAPGKLR